jgi:hypothetical protein
MNSRVVLQYFDVQGRGQVLRNALTDAGVDFEDVRIRLEDWPTLKHDPDVSGPFSVVPTLRWSQSILGEVLPIAGFLGRQLGHYDGLDDAGIARLDAVNSSCYLDVLGRLIDLLWADIRYPGVDLGRAALLPISRAVDRLARISKMIPPSGWFGEKAPNLADYFCAEALQAARHVLGPDREAGLRAQMPRLFDHSEAIMDRVGFRRAREKQPIHFTASGSEASALDRLRTLDLGSIGL